MTAKVQTQARANRIKLFKRFYRTSTPSFRVYHGSRLPPKASFQGYWRHSKFLSSGIRTGKGKTVTKTLPALKEIKATPAKRKKRGILKKKDVGKKKTIKKQLKTKKVQFAAKGKKAIAYRREQKAVTHRGRKSRVQPPGIGAEVEPLYGSMPVDYGSRGDPARPRWQRDGQQIARAPALRRRIMIL